jgi:ABC-type nitrate/sulfonate/bicarbonate transport system permease component
MLRIILLKHSGLTSDSKARILGIGLVILWLLVWEWSVEFVLGRNFFLPPSAILPLFYRSLLVTGEVRTHMWATITRLVGGLVIGAVPALWFGFVTGRNKLAGLRYGPVLAGLGLIPVLAAFPMFIVLFGIRELGKWAAVSAAVFYPILYCTTIGVRSSRAVQHVGSSPASSVSQNDWPHGAGPWIFAGLKLGVVIGMATLLGAEIFASTSGRGFVILMATRPRMDFDRLYVVMAAAALVVYALWLCLTAIEFALSRGISVRSSTGGDLPGSAIVDE